MTAKTGRVAVPEVKVNLSMISEDVRGKIYAFWQENDPDFHHMWKDASRGAEELEKVGYKVCRNEDGTPVGNGLSILCAVPLKDWVSARKAEEKRSLNQLKTVKRDDGRPMFESSLTKFANPKRPKQPEDED